MIADFIFSYSAFGDEVSWVDEALVPLMSGSCKGTHAVLVVDDESQHLAHLEQVLASVEDTLLSTQIMRQQTLLELRLPSYHVRGDFVTAVLIFQKHPDSFLLQLHFNADWNPKYLILISLNKQLNVTSLLTTPVIQRSEFIFLLQTSGKRNKLLITAYTSFPLQANSLGKQLVKASLGSWKPDRFATRESVFPKRFENFGGHVLQLSTWCDDTPFMYQNENGVCIGQSLDALEIIADKYNFTYVVQLKPEDELWGFIENGTWVGLMGGLEHGGKDLTINAIVLNWERGRDFDFVYPYQTEGFAFMIFLPPPLPSWRRLLYPFTGEVWGGVLAAALLAPSLLGLLLRWFNPVQDHISLALKIGAGLLKQSVKVSELRAWWSRVWAGWWWITVFILCTAYTGNLVAVLTVPAYPKLITTVEELATSSLGLKMLDYGNFVPEALLVSKHSSLAVLGKKMELEPYQEEDMYGSLTKDVKAGTHALLESFSYLVYVQYLYNMTYTAYIMPDKIYSSYLTWFLPRNTPYTQVFSRSLSRLKETGIMAHLSSTHLDLTIKARPVPRGGESLSLPQLQGPFLVWLLCCAVACLVFAVEYLARAI
ncbi:glutamate receptor ionotropic, delta-2-like [Portunus trituberculatus]|uniref:glutamate receptor ionotropic, delta-2-like n=1 Tax=Portunus trituberculatus TaxID=210409 RepID=UPI001E1D0B16|nr:glutamate receptor ionotropic, delta-2-like [Portunus trituberculatus]